MVKHPDIFNIEWDPPKIMEKRQYQIKSIVMTSFKQQMEWRAPFTRNVQESKKNYVTALNK